MLEFRNVSFSYGDRRILSDLSFALEPNRITALLGRNGSGKSTLLACLNQRLKYKGKILLSGEDFSHMAPRERAKHVAILPQILPAVPLTAGELVALGRSPYIGNGARLSGADRNAIKSAMEKMDLLPLENVPVSSLSGGERQNVFLAMILAQDAEIVIFDEPATYLDIERRAHFRAVLQSLKTEYGKTVFMITHDISEALRWTDRILLLDDSRIVLNGTPEECLRSDKIERTFGVRKHLFREGTEIFPLYE